MTPIPEIEEIVGKFRAGEAEVAQRFFEEKRPLSRHLDWLRFQVAREARNLEEIASHQRCELVEQVDLFERHFNIHFKAPFFLTQAFAEGCSDGQIINILDTRVRGSDPRHAAYTLSKKALLELTRMAARELGPAVRVNAVAPGMILPPPGGVVDELERRSAGLPLKRIGDTANVVAAVLFLIDNPFVTGECVYVDGGEHL